MKQMDYFNKVLRLVKEILEDPDLNSEEKVRLLGLIL